MLVLKIFLKQAKKIGLNKDNFSACLKSKKYFDKIAKDTHEGRSLGITGTPGFIINGTILIGYRDFKEFDSLIKAKLK